MLMITCEDIRELAQFQYNDDDNCVLSFYFQPRRPQNKSHREEAILAKDLVREALHGTEKNGKNKCARAVLQRILDLAGQLHGTKPVPQRCLVADDAISGGNMISRRSRRPSSHSQFA